MRALIAFLAISMLPAIGLAMRPSIFLIGAQQRYLQDQNSEMYFQQINPHFAGSLSFDFYQFGIESGSWSVSSGTPLINYDENYEEINTTHLFKMGSASEWLLFYSGFGLGVYESELTNRFNGAITKTKSGQTVMGSGILSAQVLFWHLHAGIDLKLVMAKDYRPQPTPDVSFKLGIIF